MTAPVKPITQGWGTFHDPSCKTSIIDIPIEVIAHLCKFLNPRDLESAAGVCRAFRLLLGGGFYWKLSRDATDLMLIHVISASSKMRNISHTGPHVFIKRRILYHLHHVHYSIDKPSSDEELCNATIGRFRTNDTVNAASHFLAENNLSQAEACILQAQQEHADCCRNPECTDAPTEHSLWQNVAQKLVNTKFNQGNYEEAKRLIIDIYRRECERGVLPFEYASWVDLYYLNDTLLKIISHFFDDKNYEKKILEDIADIDGFWKRDAWKGMIQKLSRNQKFDEALEILYSYEGLDCPEEAAAFRTLFYEYLICKDMSKMQDIDLNDILEIALYQLKHQDYGPLLIREISKSDKARQKFLELAEMLKALPPSSDQDFFINHFCIAARLIQLGENTAANRLFDATTKRLASKPPQSEHMLMSWYQAEYFLQSSQFYKALEILKRCCETPDIKKLASYIQQFMRRLNELPTDLETVASRVPDERSPVSGVKPWTYYPILSIKF